MPSKQWMEPLPSGIKKKQLQLMLIEDNPADAANLGSMLAQDPMVNFNLIVVESLLHAFDLLNAQTFDAAILDLDLPDGRGLFTFLKLHQAMPSLPVVVLSALDDEEAAIKAMQAGAQDYLVKRPQELLSVGRAVRYAIERNKLQLTLQESEKQFNFLFHSNLMPVGIVRVADFQIVDVNEAWSALTGYAAEEVIGRTPIEIGLMEKAVLQDIRNLLKSDGEVRQYRASLRSSTGEEKNVLITSEPIELGGEHYFLNNLLDVTERKQADDILQQRLDDLALINKLNNAINQGDNLVQVTELLGEETKKIFKNCYASVYLTNPETNMLVLQHFTMPMAEVYKLEKIIGVALPEIQIPIGGNDHYNQVMNSDQGMLITGKVEVERWLADFVLTTFLSEKVRPLILKFVPAAAKLMNIGSVISIPLKASGEVLGVIEFMTEDVFETGAFERLQNVRHQLAEVIIRKRAEQSLRESNEKYRLLSEELEERVRQRTAEVQDLYNNAPAGYHSLDIKGSLIEVNQTQLKWSGYMRAEMIGRFFGEFLTPPSREVFEREFPIFKERGSVRDMEFEMCRKDGSTFPVLINADAIYDSDGNYIMSRSTVFDNTERKQAEYAIRESEETYRSLFESANDAIFLMDIATQTYIRVNSRVPEILGVSSQEELIGRNALDFINPSELDQARDRLQALLRGDRLPPYERTFQRADGTPVRTELNVSLIRDRNGQPKFLQSVVRDITLRKQAEDALRESEAQLRNSRDKLSAANNELEKASRMKDEFLSSMSHELRTPLTGILGLSEALQFNTYGPLNEKQSKALHIIEESGRHLLDLINDILDLSKIEAGMFDLIIDQVSLGNVCQASLQLTKGMANKKNQTVRFTMEPPSIQIRGDGRRIKQMLVNLLSNAIKFTPDNGSLGLDVYGNEREKVVAITVWDKGIGIAPEQIGKLFKPFVQLESSLSRQYEGTGLGLSLVHRMAELQGGSVQVESTLGVGSRFTIRLPWQPDGWLPVASARKGAFSIKKALIVDSREIDTEQLARYLNILDIETIVHNTGRGAMELIEHETPDLVLMDLRLPEKSGFDILLEIKANPKTHSIPVIFCSIEERQSQAIALGATAYLLKPLSFTELRTEISKLESALEKEQQVASLLPIPSSTRPTVLIVDDNEVAIETISDFLESQNFQVVAAHSGAELLGVLDTLYPNVILMDIQMPGMDGLEATRRIRSHSNPYVSQIPIIVVTALAMTSDRERCLAAGANEYLSKPIRLRNLMEIVQSVLKKQQNTR